MAAKRDGNVVFRSTPPRRERLSSSNILKLRRKELWFREPDQSDGAIPCKHGNLKKLGFFSQGLTRSANLLEKVVTLVVRALTPRLI